MKILWLGEDTSLDVPIGNNLIRRMPELKGEVIGASDRINYLKSTDLTVYDVIAYWGGIYDKKLLDTVPMVKEKTDSRLICLLRATASGIPGWRADHQISIIKNLPLFDAVFTPHLDHIQYTASIDANICYLPHGIDFSKYPVREIRSVPEDAVISIGSGGMEAHRGFMWSALTYKLIKKKHPAVTGLVLLPNREEQTTAKFIKEIGLKDVCIVNGGPFNDYINKISVADVCVINLMTWGASRTVLDYAVLNIPVIKSSNIFGGGSEDPFIFYTTGCFSNVIAMAETFDKIIKDPVWHEKCMNYARAKINEFDIRNVVRKFKTYMESIL